MNPSTFRIECATDNGNPLVQPAGDLDGSTASELLNFLHDHYSGEDRVVIETGRLRRLRPFGCATFKCRLNEGRLPAHQLYFTGARGVDLAPDGSTVIAASDGEAYPCCGDCAACPCADNTESVVLPLEQ
jgi:hypothetical protein